MKFDEQWQDFQDKLGLKQSPLYLFLAFFWRNIREQHALQTAASLAYTTLLSIVPLVTVVFSIFGQLSILGNVFESIQSFVFSNFVPAFGSTVQEYIIQFSDNASKMTLTGVVILIVIALMLIATIDDAFNRIWLVKKRRSPVSRLLVYWAMITMGPLLIGFGIYLTTSVLGHPLINDVDQSLQIQSKLLRVAPFLTSAVAFTLIYMIVPNCFVPKRYALIGGVTAAVMFELAKFAFGIYVKTMPTYQNIYGAIAVVPLFLVWIYVSWVIVLIGSHLSYCLSTYRFSKGKTQFAEQGGIVEALYLLQHLWQKQQAGASTQFEEIVQQVPQLPSGQIQLLLGLLHEKQWVHQVNEEEWSLARDLHQTTLFELYQDLPGRLPDTLSNETEFTVQDTIHQKLTPMIRTHQADTKQQLSEPLVNFMI